MPRLARIVLPGLPHHITQRGNNRDAVFFCDADRDVYLAHLAEQSAKWGLRALGYCLMTNHTHLIAIPKREDSLARAVGRTHFFYTQYVNRAHGRSGHLWQNRYYSCPLDGARVAAAMRYVEHNPLRAKMARVPWRYTWSSAAAHCGNPRPADDMLDLAWWRRRFDVEEWTSLLGEAVTADEASALRNATQTGRPWASDRFLERLERSLDRRLRAKPVGRPRKDNDEKKKSKGRTGQNR